MNIHMECSKCFHEDTVEFNKIWYAPEECPSCCARDTYNVKLITEPKALVDILMDMRRKIE